MKNYQNVIFVCITLFTIACGGGSKNNAEASDATAQTVADDDHHHERYVCPMHPDVVSDQPGKCPKCGMDLEHNHEETTTNAYFMQYTATPAQIEAGKSAKIAFTPKIKGNESAQVPLDVDHEKKLHTIVVSSDLSFFDHIHPEYQADGSYSIDYTFPAGGEYLVFSDYKPSGAGHQVEKTPVMVSGKPGVAKTFSKDKLSATSGDFTLLLQPLGGKFLSNQPMHIKAVVQQKGKVIDANTLENYLGAKAHVVVVDLADKNYLHVHPEVAEGAFDLHATFEKPGIYRGWIQFQSAGKIHTADFVMNVSQGDPSKADHDHEHSHGKGADHDHH